RNRRFYRVISGALNALFHLFGGGAGLLLVTSTLRARADGKVSADLERRIQEADRERSEKGLLNADLKKKNADLVAGINEAIARKNFSWVDFFSRLESALPPRASITSINPLEVSGTRLRVAMKIISPGLPGLLLMVENLAAGKFEEVTVRNETIGGGRLISEIGFVYVGSH
ncbi:MAG: hypothetical protein ACYDH3_02755, partial [Candidatus Aminicenantales bacterium]